MPVIGKNNVQVDSRFTFDSINGSASEIVFEGTESGLQGAAQFYGSSSLYQVEFGGVGAKKVLRVRRNDIPISPGIRERTGVRLIPNTVQKSILEPPLPGALSSLTSNEIAEVRKAVDERQVREFSFTNPTQEDLYQLLLRGVEYRPVYQPILQKTIIAGNNKRWQNSFNNVGRIISPFAIYSDVGLEASAIRFVLPTNVSGDSGFVYGWLKGAPGIEPGAGNLELLTQEYQYGLWPLLIFDTAI